MKEQKVPKHALFGMTSSQQRPVHHIWRLKNAMQMLCHRDYPLQSASDKIILAISEEQKKTCKS
jgi:hypothetical protein